MKYSAYSKYKPSGVEWLDGDGSTGSPRGVPEHWEVKRLKYVADTCTGFAFNSDDYTDDGIPLIRIGDILQDGSIDVENTKKLPEEYLRLYPFVKIEKSDILMAMTGATIGKAGQYQFKESGLLNQRVCKFVPTSVYPRYLWFILKSDPYLEHIKLTGFGGAQPNISDVQLMDFLSVIPPLAEQQVIANFLDSEAGRIDELIGKKQKLIELLKEKRTALISHAVTKGLNPKVKMKPSGVEWLGAVPDHWNVKRMKHLGAIRYGLGEPPEYVDEGLPFIRATDIKRGKVEMDLVKKIRPEDVPWSRNPQLKLHEILVVRSGAYTGDSAIITSDVVDCIAGYDMVYTARKAYAPFMAWVLLSKYMLNGQIYLERMRAAQPHLNAEELGNFIVLLPSLPEQQTIADFLDHETGKIDSLISKVETAIEKLKEYRTALISAAVTGKIDVSTTLNTGSREVA